MKVVYSLITNAKKEMIAQHALIAGNFTTVTKKVLGNMQPRPLNSARALVQSFVYDEKYTYHILSTSTLYFIVLVENTTMSSASSLQCLKQMQLQYQNFYQDGQDQRPCGAFGQEMKQLMMSYNNSTEKGGALAPLKIEVDAVKATAVESIGKIIERGEKLDILVDKTDTLQAKATAFKKHSCAVKNTMRKRRLKFMACIGVAVLLVIYLLMSAICGFEMECMAEKTVVPLSVDNNMD